MMRKNMQGSATASHLIVARYALLRADRWMS
jgi:hypothetical protein